MKNDLKDIKALMKRIALGWLQQTKQVLHSYVCI